LDYTYLFIHTSQQAFCYVAALAGRKDKTRDNYGALTVCTLPMNDFEGRKLRATDNVARTLQIA
ncbi:hypothetical protein BaRGS_00026567, partial [Batillaria attramentaria]